MNQTARQIVDEYERLAMEYSCVLKAEKFYQDMADSWRAIAEFMEDATVTDELDENHYDRWGMCE